MYGVSYDYKHFLFYTQSDILTMVLMQVGFTMTNLF